MGRWVEKEVRKIHPDLPWSSTGPDLTVGEVTYEILKDTAFNRDKHAKRMPDTMYRMIPFTNN